MSTRIEYPLDFIARAKAFSDNAELHKSLDEGTVYAANYFFTSPGDSIDASWVISMIDDGMVKELKEIAVNRLTNHELCIELNVFMEKYAREHPKKYGGYL